MEWPEMMTHLERQVGSAVRKARKAAENAGAPGGG